MTEILLAISISNREYNTYLTAMLISHVVSIDYWGKYQYNFGIFCLFYLYLVVRFWETSDHIFQYLLILLVNFLKLAHSFYLESHHKKADPKIEMANYFLKCYPGLTVLLSEKIEKKGENLINEFDFDLIFANESAIIDFSIKDSSTLLKVLENIQLNSNDIVNSDQSPTYSPNIKSKKYSKLSKYFLSLKKNQFKNLPKFQKFLVSYSKKINSSLENETAIKMNKDSQYRVILILFEINGKLAIFMNMEDSNIENQLKKFKEMDEFKDQMLASITHDLKSPLSSVLTLIGNAKKMIDQEERGKSLDYAIHNGNLLLNQINDLLDYSQMRRGKFSLFFTHFPMSQILDDVVKLMKIQSDLKGVGLKVDNQLNLDRNPSFFSDYRRIKQILINLIGNALKFTDKGTIVIKVAHVQSPNIIKFEVIDTGEGIKQDIISKLGKAFNSFEREGALNYEGFGLGLHICKTIIGQLGPFEKIHISSHVGSGSKFGFLIYQICEKKNQKFLTADQLDDMKKKHSFLFAESKQRNESKLDDEFSNFYSKEICCSGDFDEKKNTIETKNYLFSKNHNINDLKNFLTSSKIPKNNKDSNPLNVVLSTQEIKKSNFFNKNLDKVTNETSLNELILKGPKKIFRILIVDDDPFNHFIMKGYIKQMKNNIFNMVMEYDEAINGIKAVDFFKRRNAENSKNPFNLIILDCQMPLQNGFKTALQIKEAINNERFIDCKIVGCSALYGNNEEVKCFESRMDIFMPKPISFENFNEVLLTQMKVYADIDFIFE